ncbi:protein TIC [Forsythia ovata]|uniref:Protein TIC 20 n=1 Tax=Forsythia ovata TaxID=205694 RepID=A0ABD1VFX1_9LAMI
MSKSHKEKKQNQSANPISAKISPNHLCPKICFFFTEYLFLSLSIQPLLHLLSFYHCTSFISFFTLSGHSLKPFSLSRYAQFNALSAMVLDVVLMLVQGIISPGWSGIKLKIMTWEHSEIFAFVVACFVYGVVSSILRKTLYLPFVAEAVGRQLE